MPHKYKPIIFITAALLVSHGAHGFSRRLEGTSCPNGYAH